MIFFRNAPADGPRPAPPVPGTPPSGPAGVTPGPLPAAVAAPGPMPYRRYLDGPVDQTEQQKGRQFWASCVSDEARLIRENRELRERLLALDKRLAEMEAVNRAYYEADYKATALPTAFDKDQPLGKLPRPTLGTMPFGWHQPTGGES